MSQPTPPRPPVPASNTPMTPEEALAILHHFHDAVGSHLYREEATEDEQALRNQVWTALRVVCILVHGQAPLECMQRLCEICYLCYVPTDNPLVRLKGSSRLSKSPCTPCLEQLKAEGSLAEIINGKTGEVTSC